MFWSCAQLETHHERLALHCLGLAGYQVYQPRIRRVTARKSSDSTALFPAYAFVRIELQWHAARWSPGVIRILLNGERPARVPDQVITELRNREDKRGLITLPRPPGLQRGDQVRIVAGPFTHALGLYDGMRPHQRVAVLLRLLGGLQRVELAARNVASV